ncbi:putative ankyrin repeat protein RF_0381 [Cloeon dipterum]|uniref:putative ankyrin repeat protein RF_0381 n=1 Tax=Cloeon dipterum TaxID=197152 RepID=UPI00321FBD84
MATNKKNEQGLTPLMIAARDENLEACIALLQQGADVHAETESGETILHFAAQNKRHGHEIAWLLVHKHKLDATKRDVKGNEAIIHGIRNENFRFAQELFRLRECEAINLFHLFISLNQSDVALLVHAWNPLLIREVDGYGRNALHLAAEFADLRVCQLLIEMGIDAASNSYFGMALHRAPLNKNHGIEIIKYFVSLKLNLNEVSESGLLPLHAAFAAGNLEIAHEMLKLGAILDTKNWNNYLFLSIAANNHECANFIHNFNGELIMRMNLDGRTALHLAAEFADAEMLKWILSTNIGSKCFLDQWKCSILHHIAFNRQFGPQLVRLFSSIGVDLNCKDEGQNTPLIFALRAINLDVAQELLNHGATLNSENEDVNLLHLCINENNLEGAKFVHSKIPELVRKLSVGGMTSLHLAASYADLNMCLWIVGLNFDVQDKSGEDGNTVLHCAAYNLNHGASLVQFFVSKGVNVNEKNFASKTALHPALLEKNIGFARELLQAGAELKAILDDEGVQELTKIASTGQSGCLLMDNTVTKVVPLRR